MAFDLGSLLGMAGSLLGSTVGGPVGGQLGGAVGTVVGNSAKKKRDPREQNPVGSAAGSVRVEPDNEAGPLAATGGFRVDARPFEQTPPPLAAGGSNITSVEGQFSVADAERDELVRALLKDYK